MSEGHHDPEDIQPYTGQEEPRNSRIEDLRTEHARNGGNRRELDPDQLKKAAEYLSRQQDKLAELMQNYPEDGEIFPHVYLARDQFGIRLADHNEPVKGVGSGYVTFYQTMKEKREDFPLDVNTRNRLDVGIYTERETLQSVAEQAEQDPKFRNLLLTAIFTDNDTIKKVSSIPKPFLPVRPPIASTQVQNFIESPVEASDVELAGFAISTLIDRLEPKEDAHDKPFTG